MTDILNRPVFKMNRREIFLSAITDRDGVSVNPGYLWIMQSGRIAGLVCGSLVLAAFTQFAMNDWKEFPFMLMAGACATIIGAYGGLVTLIGGFIALDGKGAQMAQFPPAQPAAAGIQVAGLNVQQGQGNP